MEQVIEMSIEFEAQLPNALPEQSVSRFRDYVAGQTQLKVVRIHGAEFGLANSDKEPEIITIIVHPTNIYIAFHAFPRPKRESFLKAVNKGLENEGISIDDFEEL